MRTATFRFPVSGFRFPVSGFWFLVSGFWFLLTGCPSAEHLTYAPCVKPDQQQLVIRWGTRNDSTQTADDYALDAMGQLFYIQREGNSADSSRVALVPHAQYCSQVGGVTTTFVKVQALHSPGTKARYIEYSNPQANVFLRAVWNPDLNTFQSRDMRAQFDSLMALVTAP